MSHRGKGRMKNTQVPFAMRPIRRTFREEISASAKMPSRLIWTMLLRSSASFAESLSGDRRISVSGRTVVQNKRFRLHLMITSVQCESRTLQGFILGLLAPCAPVTAFRLHADAKNVHDTRLQRCTFHHSSLFPTSPLIMDDKLNHTNGTYLRDANGLPASAVDFARLKFALGDRIRVSIQHVKGTTAGMRGQE